MSDATLTQISSAIYAALSAGPIAPFAVVMQWNGPADARRIDLSAVGNTPAAIIAPVGAISAPKDGVRTIALATAESVESNRWAVFVVCTDARAPTDVGADTSSTNVLACIDAVIARLAGLVIAGLFQSDRLEYDGWQNRSIPNGVYVYEVRFFARRTVKSVTPTDTSVPLTEIKGDVNAGDSTSNPTQQVKVLF